MGMVRVSGGAGARPSNVAPRPRSLPATGVGWRSFVPGLAQWSWGQPERGAVFLGTFLAALVSAAFAWGTPVGLGFIALAFATHVASTVDALSQAAFPGLVGWASWMTVGGWLGCAVYGPVLLLVSLVAWPGVRGREGVEGYLVNCWAYRDRAPDLGEWVWYHAGPRGDARLGRVVAMAGQDVEWSRNRLRIDGGPVDLPVPARSNWPPRALAYTVPEGHLLINPEADPDAASGLVLVDRDQVVGRAWARYYPVLERRLLD